jgi:hypothetical protein
MSKTKAQPQPKVAQPGKKPGAVWSAERAARLREGARLRAALDCACDCNCACK